MNGQYVGMRRRLRLNISQRLVSVVSIGHSLAFYVVFIPLEYIPSILHHSTYVIVSHTFRERVTIELYLEEETM